VSLKKSKDMIEQLYGEEVLKNFPSYEKFLEKFRGFKEKSWIFHPCFPFTNKYFYSINNSSGYFLNNFKDLNT
jgi:hypothetical protein